MDGTGAPAAPVDSGRLSLSGESSRAPPLECVTALGARLPHRLWLQRASGDEDQGFKPSALQLENRTSFNWV